MKFLAFVDLHLDFMDILELNNVINADKPDFIICAGDFTLFGDKMEDMLDIFNNFGKKIYLIHGNHEEEDDLREVVKKYKNIKFVHKKIIFEKDIAFVFFGGGGFSEKEPDFKEFIEKNRTVLKKARDIVLVTHAPPKNTAVDEVAKKSHVGVKDFKDFIDEFQPVLSISGHIHETYKKQEEVGRTLVINPGWDGEIFKL